MKSSKKPNPPISDFMTTIPVRLEETESLQTALHLMQRYDIRHLPVTRGGALAGVVSESGLRVMMGVMSQVDVVEQPVKIMVRDSPYTTAPDTPFKDVIGEMLRRRVSSVVVMKDEQIFGIFTITDALKLIQSAYDADSE